MVFYPAAFDAYLTSNGVYPISTGVPLPSNGVAHLVIGRESGCGPFGEGVCTVDLDLEDTAAAGNELDLGVAFLGDNVPRTEGSGFVVSDLAVFDSDFHGGVPFGCHA